jgi:hypothetical protein
VIQAFNKLSKYCCILKYASHGNKIIDYEKVFRAFVVINVFNILQIPTRIKHRFTAETSSSPLLFHSLLFLLSFVGRASDLKGFKLFTLQLWRILTFLTQPGEKRINPFRRVCIYTGQCRHAATLRTAFEYSVSVLERQRDRYKYHQTCHVAFGKKKKVNVLFLNRTGRQWCWRK